MKVATSKQVNDPPPARAPKASIVCPYCGESQPTADECRSCRGLFEPLSRQATQNAMGPWRIRDEAAPFRPPCSYATLLVLIKKGKITRESVISGPTTRQFWARADETPGISHLFHVCHSCRAAAHPTDAICIDCGASFLAPEDRNALGLAPIRPLTPAPARPSTPAQPSADPFAVVTPGASGVPSPSARHTRLPVVILIVAVVVAVAASGMAIYRWQQQPPPNQGDAAPAAQPVPVDPATS
ncbi:MAG: hypothetical protein AB7G17_12755 [Phycisphaerales bacterium]